jgi:sulfur-oxidizing protein SoxY
MISAIRMVDTVNHKRREVLKSGGAASVFGLFIAAGLVMPRDASAQEWNAGAFQGKTLAEVLKALGASGVSETKAVNWGTTPEIAENGAVVPVAVASNLPGTDWIALLVLKNPNMLAAAFDIPAGTDPSISTRVKMGQSSDVHALIRAGGKYFVATREIKVTLGGCGG